MSNIITRDEYNKYIAVKSKLSLQNKETQTDFPVDLTQLIPIICTLIPSSEHNQTTTDEDGTDEPEDYAEDEYEEETNDMTDTEDDPSTDETTTSKNIKNKILHKMKKRRYANPKDDEYYRNLPLEERKRVKTIEDTIYDEMKSETPLRFKILSSNIDTYLKTLCLKKLDQLDAMHSHTDEYYKLHQWVESVVRLPIGKYKELPFDKNSSEEDITTFLNDIRKRLDDNVYGHQCTKEHIIRLLAKWISNKNSKGLVIGIEGEMGVGKTSLCLEICKALDLPYGFVSLGGLSNSEYLVGHSYTYEGSKWGKIAEILMHSNYSNPIIYFDELDKVSNSRYGEEIINTLIHVTDSTQNYDFRDKYFSEVPIDLSRCIIIFSYNHGDQINPILKDRMVTLKASNYNMNDKIVISKKHMIPKILEEYGFEIHDIVFTDEMIKFIVQQTEDEHGVRKLRRSLEEIISQVNVLSLMKKGIFKESEQIAFPLHINEKVIMKLLPKKANDYSKNPYMYI
jgi:ATP-dependent Lon protease